MFYNNFHRYVSIFIISISFLVFGCGERASDNNSKKENQLTNNHSMQSTDSMDQTMHNNMIHEGKIDVQSIDVNKDDRLFECPMDWNVISDSPGRCPVCEMNLKEFSISEVKNNLVKHGHEIIQ
jgi:Cu(I)/Ag(I) efflux system membrane fusion protein/cobalt-zinc-cadmium efflux system membrane fusion protein